MSNSERQEVNDPDAAKSAKHGDSGFDSVQESDSVDDDHILRNDAGHRQNELGSEMELDVNAKNAKLVASESINSSTIGRLVRPADESIQKDLQQGHSPNGRELVAPLHALRGFKWSSSTLAANADEKPSNVTEMVHAEQFTEISKVLDLTSKSPQGGGLPTALCVTGKYILVGTSRGLILVFDTIQELRMILGYGKRLKSMSEAIVASEISYGAITALTISRSCDTFLCGFATGRIEFWDLERGTRIKSIIDCHKKAVVFLSFLPDVPEAARKGPRSMATVKHYKAISIDLTGVSYILFISKMIMMHVVETKCLLDGTSGSIKAFAILPDTPFLALASGKECFVISLSDQGNDAKVNYVWPNRSLNSDMEKDLSFPALTWRRARDDQGQILPLLARALSNHVDFLSCLNGEYCPTSRSFECESSVMALYWLSESVLMLLTDKYTLLALDVIGMVVVDKIDISDVQLIWTSFGNQEHSFYNSISCFDSTLFLLGIKKLISVKIKTWIERVNSHISYGNWMEALALALDQYQLNGNKERNRMAEILLHFATSRDLGRQEAGACIEFCIEIERTDILFNAVYECFVSSDKKAIFLEVLEPYILNRLVTGISPMVLHDFVELYKQENKLDRVEECILHLDPITIRSDLDTLVKLSKKYSLWSALIHLYISGLNDWETPALSILDSSITTSEKVKYMKELLDRFVEEAEDPIWESKCINLIHRSLPQKNATELTIRQLRKHEIAGGLTKTIMKRVMTRLLIDGVEEDLVKVLANCDADSFDFEEIRTHVKAYGWKDALMCLCHKALEVAKHSGESMERIELAYCEIIEISDSPASFCKRELERVRHSILQLEALQRAILKSLKQLYGKQPNEMCRLVATGGIVKSPEDLYGIPRLQYEYMKNREISDHKQFVALMCEIEPKQVYSYVKKNEGFYPLHEILETCRAQGIRDATAYLMERVGDTESAVDLILEEVEEAAIRNNKYDLANSVRIAIEMCERSCLTGLDLENAQKLWFRLLEKVINCTEKLECGSNYLQAVLNRMMPHVNSQSIIQMVKSREFGHLRKTLQGMLYAKYLEIDILRTSSRLIASDMLQLVRKKHQLLGNGERLDRVRIRTVLPKSKTTTETDNSKESWFEDWENRFERFGEIKLRLEPPN